MKQTAEAAVVLGAVGLVFAAVTAVGFRPSANPDDPQELLGDGVPGWLSSLGSHLPAPMPSVEVSRDAVTGRDPLGKEIEVGFRTDPESESVTVEIPSRVSVTVGVPPSDEDFRRADLYLISGGPVTVELVDNGVGSDSSDEPAGDEPPSLEPDEAEGQGRQRMRLVISKQGGTITLRGNGGDSGVSTVRFE